MDSGLAGTGIAGLDDVLKGGWPRNRVYLVQGEPGVGKTTLAFQFLLEGKAKGETCLYVTLAETRDEIAGVAAAHGWDLDGITIFELSSVEDSLTINDNSLFDPADVDLRDVTNALLSEVERVSPQRVVFDSLSEIRLLAQDPLRYRRQILAMKAFFAGRKATVLLLDDNTIADEEQQVRSLVHGVLSLEKLAPEYGAERRRLQILKLRGVAFRGGNHDYTVEHGGIEVYPRLVAADDRRRAPSRFLTTGVRALDALLGGGIAYGTSTLLVGPAGSGKSTLCALFAIAAARDKSRVALYSFEEGVSTLFERTESLGIKLEEAVTAGQVEVRPIDPAELTPGQFAHMVRKAIDDGVEVIVIDSLNGYLSAMPEETFLTLHMHELLTYATQRGVAIFLVMAQHGFMGSNMDTPVDISFVSDTVVLLRYFESDGAIRKAISVVKSRRAAHETAIRELAFGPEGVIVGAALRGFRGVLTGVPEYIGRSAALVGDDDQAQ